MLEGRPQGQVEFHTPLWILAGADERTDIKHVVSAWKTAFLRDEHVKTYNILIGNTKKKSKLLVPFRMAHAFLKWFWPILILAAVSSFSLAPAMFLAVALIPIQVIIFTALFAKVYDGVCINSVIKLEKRLRDD